MAFLAWSPELELGVRSIDAQHRDLVEIIDGLHAAVTSGDQDKQITSKLDDLVSHVVRHFAHEEQLMAAHRYSEAGSHRVQHEDFKARAAGLVARMKGGEQVLTPATLEFLRSWLTAHMSGPDRRMTSFLSRQGAA